MTTTTNTTMEQFEEAMNMDYAISVRFEAKVADGYTFEEALDEATSEERYDFNKAMDAIEDAIYVNMSFSGRFNVEEEGISFEDIKGVDVDEDGIIYVDDEIYTDEHVVALEKAIKAQIAEYNSHSSHRYAYSIDF